MSCLYLDGSKILDFVDCIQTVNKGGGFGLIKMFLYLGFVWLKTFLCKESYQLPGALSMLVWSDCR